MREIVLPPTRAIFARVRAFLISEGRLATIRARCAAGCGRGSPIGEGAA
jgi:hypothetical protein